ncbi:MAG: hypothetical protein P8Z42_06115 [Anaerolineales bacterium]
MESGIPGNGYSNHIALLQEAKQAFIAGENQKARRLCRRAIQLKPKDELPWILLAKYSEPRTGLECLARALEINPKSRVARKMIRELIRRMPGMPLQQGQNPFGIPSGHNDIDTYPQLRTHVGDTAVDCSDHHIYSTAVDTCRGAVRQWHNCRLFPGQAELRRIL